jgi:hypothetical protein
MFHSRSVFVLAGLIMATPWSSARAQYPSLFLNSPAYGEGAWSWFGSTPEGDINRGIGAYLAGTGFYQYNTAWAAAIDSDRMRRENDYLARVQEAQSRRYARRLAAEQERINRIRKEIDDRYRDAPTAWDVEHGDALNHAFRLLTASPSVLRRDRGAGPTISIALVRRLPLRYAPGAETIRLDRVMDLPSLPPAVRAYVLGVGADPLADYLKRLESESETTVGQLLGFMQDCHLQFGVAESGMQKAAYRELYQHLASLIRTERPAEDRVAPESR